MNWEDIHKLKMERDDYDSEDQEVVRDFDKEIEALLDGASRADLIRAISDAISEEVDDLSRVELREQLYDALINGSPGVNDWDDTKLRRELLSRWSD